MFTASPAQQGVSAFSLLVKHTHMHCALHAGQLAWWMTATSLVPEPVCYLGARVPYLIDDGDLTVAQPHDAISFL